ncbi:MAG: hypothetical protein ACQEWM_11230 [Actinomycetota bacterium]
MRWSDRLFKRPPLIVAGEPATGWLGLVTSWGTAGYGASSASSATGMLLSADAGACGALSSTVCQVAGWGGLLMGVVLLAVAAVLGLVVARGFGPPITWWVLPLMLAALALAPFRAAEGAALPWVWLLLALAAAMLAIALGAAAIRQGKAALYGWIRLDGLDAREVAHRPIDRLLAPIAGTAAAVAALFGAHVIRILSET